jgi:hypothetical protein
MSYTNPSLLDAMSLAVVVIAVQRMAAVLMTVQYVLAMMPRGVVTLEVWVA